MGFWSRIRFLITDGCNYSCPFCHNEGQLKQSNYHEMSFGLFKRILDIVSGARLEDICISGGEPFLNPNVVDMLLYARMNTATDISCASNLSLVSDVDIDRLVGARVKFNIQFPFASPEKFSQSTGCGNLAQIDCRIDKMISAGMAVGLNTVLQKGTIAHLEDILIYAAQKGVSIKLLPEIGRKESASSKAEVERLLGRRILSRKAKGTGAVAWRVETSCGDVRVLFIDSPCITGSFGECRTYGELRILPDGGLQPCLLRQPIDRVDENDEPTVIMEKLQRLWNDFKSC